MPFAFYILFGAALTAASCWAAGALLLHALRIGLKRQERGPLAFLSGAALVSTAVFLLAASKLVYKGTLLALAAALFLAVWRTGAWRPRGDSFPPLSRKARCASLLIAAPFLLLTFTHAMAPEMSPDGSAYHLGLVSRYYRWHGFERITTNMYAYLSQGVEMLFLFAYAFGRHSAAALVHWCFLPAAALAIWNYGRRAGHAAAGLAAAFFFFLSPVVQIDAASAYNDAATAAIVFAAFYATEIWAETRQRGLLIVTGLLCGFAFAAKYTAFLALPYCLGRVLLVLWRERRPWLKPALALSLAALALMLPWLVKNAVWLHNPAAPFFNRTFPNPFVTPAFEDHYKHHMRNYSGLASHWDIPLEVTVRGQVLCGLLGPLFLLAPFALLPLRHPLGRRLLFAAAFFASVYATNIGTRFLIPALPFLSLALALAFAPWRFLLPALVLFHALSAWPDLMKRYCHTYAWRLDRIWWKPALRLESEEGFLARRWPPYNAARLIENLVPQGERVFTFNQAAEAYTSRDILVAYQSAEGAALGTILWTPLIPEYKPVRVLDFQFQPRAVRQLRIEQTASHPLDQWALHEVRVYDGNRELPRDPAWRLTARPFPWTIQDAFDNSLLSHWRTNEPIRPGMFAAIDFGRPETISRVILESAPVEHNSRVRLLADGAPLAGAPTVRESPPPLGLRRAAAQELKHRGVQWLLTAEGDFAFEDLYNRREDWGVELAGETGASRLYRIR
jgi:4-amino-4-deoxy-L-arabinose transferase-like glycosyltransferase